MGARGDLRALGLVGVVVVCNLVDWPVVWMASGGGGGGNV